MEEETNDPLGILTKPPQSSDPLGILVDSKKKVPTEPDGMPTQSGSATSDIGGEGDPKQIGRVTESEILRINEFLKTAPKAKSIDVENVNVVEKITADNNIVTQKPTVTGVELTPEDEYISVAPKAYEESLPIILDNAIQRGKNQADLASSLTAFGDDPEKASFDEIAKIQEQNRNLRTSEAYMKFNNAKTFSEGMDAFLESPLTVVSELTLESMTALLRHGLVRMGAGAVTGGIAGSVIPGAGTLAGAGYGVLAGVGSSSLNLEYSGKMMEVFEDMGVDTTDPKQLEEVFSDEKKVAEARSHALKKGIPVAIFDMVSGGIAGKVVSKPAKTLLAKAGGWGLEMATQSGLGAGGELAGELVAGEEIQPSAILGEALGELGGGVGEIMVGSTARQLKSKMDLVKSVGALPSDANKAEIIKDQIGLSLVSGEISAEEAADLTQAGATAIEVDKTIPIQVEGVQRAESLPILIEKKQLEGQVALLEAQKEATDPSFHSVIDDQIKVVQDQIAEKDNQIKKIIAPQDELSVDEPVVEVVEPEKATQEPVVASNEGVVADVASTEGSENKVDLDKIKEATDEISSPEFFNRDSSTLKSVFNTISTNSKKIADLLESPPFASKGFSGLDVPSQRVVKGLVLAARNNDEIFNSIVKFIPIDVMDALRGKEVSLDMIFHDESMLSNLFASDEKNSIPISGNSASSIIKATTSAIAEYINTSDAANPSTEISSAIGTSDNLEIYHDANISNVSISNQLNKNQNEQEVNEKGQRREELLSPTESAKTEPVSEVEAQKAETEKRIEASNKRIDSIAKTIKDILKVDVVPGAQKMGSDTGAIIDMIAQASKHLVNKGIKTQAAIEQVIKALRDAGHISGKEITRMRNGALSSLDEESEKVWVTKSGKYTLLQNSFGDFEVRDDKDKPVTKKSIRKSVISEYVKGKDLTKGELANLEGIQEKDANRFIAENSKNPMQVAQAMAFSNDKISEDQMDYKEQIIAQHLPFVSRASFIEGKDVSDLIDEKGKFQEGTAIQYNYLRANGLALDKAAEAVNSGAGQENDFVTEQDIVDFILKYPKGKSQFYGQANPDYLALQNKFHELTGFNATPEILEQAKDYTEVEGEDDFGGLEPVDGKEATDTKEPEQKKRRFSKQYLASEDISGETKAMASKNALNYLTQTNVMSVAEANSVIDELGIDAAEALARDFNNGINGGVRSVLLQSIIKKHEKAGNSSRADDLFEFATEKFTDAGQFIQAAYLWGKLTPEGQVRMAEKAVEKDRSKREKQDKTAIDRTKKAVKKVVKETIDEALVSVGVETAIEQAAEVVEEKAYGSKNKVVSKDRYKAALAKFKKSGKLFSGGFAEEIVEIAAYHAEASGREFAKFAKKVVKDLGVAIKPRLRELYEKAREKAISEGVDKDELATKDDVSEYYANQQINKIEKTVRTGLKELNKKISDIAKAHYTEYDATKSELADKLVAEADLEPADAKRLADAIKKEFDRIFEKKKKDLLNTIVKEKPSLKKDTKKIDELSENLLKLVNLGAFSDAEFLSAWAKANGYPELTEENIKEIKRLADIVESFKDEGNEKFRAIEDLLSYQARIKNISLRDIAQAFWYAHILSGYKTQLVNAASNAINSFMESIVQMTKTAVKNPSDIKYLYQGWYNGIVQGLWLEADEVLRSGYNPIRGKIEIPATLEIISKYKPEMNLKNSLKVAIWGYSNVAKYVRRVMVATDVVFYEGLKEMRAYQLAASMARDEQKLNPSLDVRNKALDILNKTDPQYLGILNNAKLEYDSKVDAIKKSDATEKEKNRLLDRAKRDMVRRVYELTQLGRNEEEIVEPAKTYAAKGTFNYKPEGFLGALVRSINNANNQIPLLRYIIPFTNIIANVANETLNYTPYGALRAASKGTGGHLTGHISERTQRETPLTSDEQADLLIKSAIGVAAMTVAMMLSGATDDKDDKPILEITGGATGDFKKNYNLKDWLQYSFRVKNPATGEYSNWISYQNTPMYLALAYIGNLRDLEKYRGDKLDENTFLKYRMALTNTKTLFLNMTFLSTMNTFLNDVFNSQGGGDLFDKSVKNLSNIGKGFVMPNIWSQMYKDFQIEKNIPIKETTLDLEKPWMYVAPVLKDIPFARNVYFDKIDAFGDPIIPTADRFTKFKSEIPKQWETIAKYKMMNLNVPSIRTVKLPDPSSVKDGEIRETFLTDQEYYEFCIVRGGILKAEMLDAPIGDWDYANVIKKGSGDKMAKDWMTSVQKEATTKAKDVILYKRLYNFK